MCSQINLLKFFFFFALYIFLTHVSHHFSCVGYSALLSSMFIVAKARAVLNFTVVERANTLEEVTNKWKVLFANVYFHT